MPQQRLSVLDRTFLDFESDAYPQHVGATLLFEVGPLRNPAGGIDADRVRAHVESRLHRIPRYRQRLAWIPIERHPVWVDDDRFNIHYHVRHAALPKPGSERQLKRLVARIMSQRLDYGKPLWELWVIEGLEGDRGALISKTHHCMIDGIAGVDLLTILLSSDPDEEDEAPPRWMPEPAPTPLELAGTELWRRATMPISAARGLLAAAQQPTETLDQVREQVSAVVEALGAGLVPASNTPLNQDLGPHRRFDWLTIDLAPVREIKKRLGGTVNDVVLATVAGALGDFLEQRGVTRGRQRALEIRAMVPVSVRPAEAARHHRQPDRTLGDAAADRRDDPNMRLAAVAKITDGAEALEAGARRRSARRRQRVDGADAALDRLARGVPEPRREPRRHQCARPADSALPARRARARDLSDAESADTPEPRGRALLLRGTPALGIHRGLGSGARSPRLRRCHRARLRGSLRSGRPAASHAATAKPTRATKPPDTRGENR